jgi:hypothetical protein
MLTSPRDIYYRDPALFSKQAVVDRYVDDLACTFGIPRALLNVVGIGWYTGFVIALTVEFRPRLRKALSLAHSLSLDQMEQNLKGGRRER